MREEESENLTSDTALTASKRRREDRRRREPHRGMDENEWMR